MNNELEALQNAANAVGVPGLTVYENYTQDRRKKVKTYFLSLNGSCLSPTLPYMHLNHFILGAILAKKLF